MAKTETTTKAAVGRYVEGVGRRKTAIARVRVTSGQGRTTVNERAVKDYFTLLRDQQMILAPFKELSLDAAKYNLSVHVVGGGHSAQAEAVRHGLSRALVTMDETVKKKLRTAGFLTRDPRMVERKHYGLKKARRAPQWSKR